MPWYLWRVFEEHGDDENKKGCTTKLHNQTQKAKILDVQRNKNVLVRWQIYVNVENDWA